MNAPIRVRLTAYYALMVAVVLAALVAFVIARLRSDLTALRDRSLLQNATQIAQGYEAHGGSEFLDRSRVALPGFYQRRSGAQVLDSSGAVVLSYGNPVMRMPVVTRHQLQAVMRGSQISFDVNLGPEHLHAVAWPVTRHRQRQVLVVVNSLALIDHAVHQVLVLVVIGAVAALAFLLFGSWWITRKALRPVEQMASRAAHIGIEEIRDQRIAVPDVKDELSYLALTLNSMLDRLQDGVQARECLIANAAHELRAPLAAMRSELEVSLRHDELSDEARSILASARQDTVRLSSIVENLLTLARIDEGHMELLLGSLDLREVALAAARVHRGAAECAHVKLIVEGEPGAIVGDRDRIQQIVSNLIDNAVRSAPPGSAVNVKLWRSATQAGITVSDAGPGVPVDERQRIFERFVRRDDGHTRTSGAGLGLAIAREIAHAHGGEIWVEDRRPNGARFTVALPAAVNGGPDHEHPAAPLHAEAATRG